MRLRLLLPVGLLACSGTGAVSTAQETSVASASALSEAADTSSALELQGLLDLARAAESERGPGPGALRCDESPDITEITVCGKTLPGTAHYEWTECSAQAMRGAPGEGAGPPDGGPCAGGSGPQGPSGDHPRGGGRPPHHQDGAPAGSGEGGKPPRDRGGNFADSSGKVDITVTATAPDTCDDTTKVTIAQAATFEITHKAKDDASDELKGTSQTTSVRTASDKRSSSRTAQLDVTHTRKDSAGAVVQSLHLSGGSTSANDGTVTPPTRTYSGSFTFEESKDGVSSSGTIALDGLVRVPPDKCFWPIAGKITKTAADSTQVLEFGATCGSATLDGAAVDLTSLVAEKRGPGKGERPNKD